MLVQDIATALLFPGQASHYVGMGKEFYDNFSYVRTMYALASDIASYSMPQLCFEDPDGKLKQTQYAQPAIFVTSLAVAEVLERELGISKQVTVMAGHSLGEISALTAAQSFALDDAIRLVIARGKAMQEAIPSGQGKMVALIGLSEKLVSLICQRVVNYGMVTIANINTPQQIVVAGHTPAVEQASKLARAGGAKVVSLDVSAPFHSPLMEPAAEELRRILAGLLVRRPKCLVLRNVDSRPHKEPNAIKEYLVRQVTFPVNWPGMINALLKQEVKQFIIPAPSQVLFGLMRRIDQHLNVSPVEDLSALRSLFKQGKQAGDNL